MFQYKNVTINLMGVINITPNSFSDGGEFNSSEKFLEQAHHLLANGADILDIGAESSAPMNRPISENLEIKRFNEIFLPNLNQLPKELTLSIDTYKLETMQYLLKQTIIQEYYEKKQLIWNDVSGQVQDSKKLMELYPLLSYVHCHNNISDRSKTLDHMNYCQDSIDLEDYFKDSKFILDPCFGFSKTREQNYEIWRKLPDLLEKFHENTWVIGISRKSFLRFLNLDKNDPALIAQTDMVQSIVLKELILDLSALNHDFNLILRIHDPYVFQSIRNSFIFN